MGIKVTGTQDGTTATAHRVATVGQHNGTDRVQYEMRTGQGEVLGTVTSHRDGAGDTWFTVDATGRGYDGLWRAVRSLSGIVEVASVVDWTPTDVDTYRVEYGDETGAQVVHEYDADQDAAQTMLDALAGVEYAGSVTDDDLEDVTEPIDDERGVTRRAVSAHGYDPRTPDGGGRGNWTATYVVTAPVLRCEYCGEAAFDEARDENAGGPWVAVCREHEDRVTQHAPDCDCTTCEDERAEDAEYTTYTLTDGQVDRQAVHATEGDAWEAFGRLVASTPRSDVEVSIVAARIEGGDILAETTVPTIH